jgi:hypothetical protein
MLVCLPGASIGDIYRKSVAKTLKAFGYRLAIDIPNAGSSLIS